MNKLQRSLAITLTVSACTMLSACSTDEALKQLGKSGLLKSGSGPLSLIDITNGLKQALSQGSNTVVGQLGSVNGFNADPTIRIPLPNALAKARDFAGRFGLDASFNDLETRLNRAAEKATPKAKDLFLGAIRSMTVEDAKGILNGADDAATRFFERKTRTQLAGEMRPLVDQSLSEVGAVNTFKQLLSSYQKIPLAPKVNADLTSHVVDKGMNGIFHYIAREEKAIRENPIKRTTALLQRVFGSR